MPTANARDSLFEQGKNCCAVARAERAAMVVDGEAYFAAFMEACENAQRSILIVAWDFDSRAVLRFDENKQPVLTLGEFLNDLARRKKRLNIHILDWDYPMVFGLDRELPPAYGLSWEPHRRVHFDYDNTHPVSGSHHQKIVIVDDKLAFVGGLDLTFKRWDTRDHAPGDARRIARGKPYPPFHDMMMAVDGEAAGALASIVRKRFKKALDIDIPRVSVPHDPWPVSLPPALRDVTVGVACTSPNSERDDGVRDIEALYLDMIARAQRYIYIENQYFTSHRIGEALLDRLLEEDGPEIVLVTRLLSHGWLEEMTMHVLRTKLVRDLREADHAGRFEVYYPHVDGLEDGTCIDMHAKLMIVDDEWLRIGSSNLSNRSMGFDTECDVVVEAAGTAEVAQTIRRFRDDLLAEHSGSTPEAVAAMVERCGGLHAALEILGTPQRQLRPLEAAEAWSDTMLATVSLADPEKPVSVDQLVQQFAPHESEAQGPSRWPKLVAFGLVMLALALSWRYTPLAEWITADNITDLADAVSGYWWAPVVLLLAYTPASFIMFPRPLLTLAGVVAFGPWEGFTIAMSGLVLASAVHFFIGRLMRRDAVRRMAGPRMMRILPVLRRRGLLAMTAVRLVPVAPFPVAGIVAGALRLKLWHLAVGTFIGMAPGALAATVFADQLQTALGDASQINYWLVAGVILFFAVAILWMRRWFRKQTAQAQDAGRAAPKAARVEKRRQADARADRRSRHVPRVPWPEAFERRRDYQHSQQA